jgi:hypothetical protein
LCDDDVTYERMRAVDSDDDCVVPPPSPRTIEIMKRLFPGHDPLVSHFHDFRESHRAVADGGALEDDIPRPESSIIIHKGHVLRIEALKMWLREYVVVHNQPYCVKNSHAARRYIITCESTHWQWKVRGRKMKGSNKFKITSVVGPHTYGSASTDVQIHCKSLITCSEARSNDFYSWGDWYCDIQMELHGEVWKGLEGSSTGFEDDLWFLGGCI